jgi:integrase
VRALDAWLIVRASLGRDSGGPLFPSLQCAKTGPERSWRPLDGRDVARIVQRAARAAGLDPRHYRPHGLRAGFATEASRRGASVRELQAHLRHRDLATTLGYVRTGDALGAGNPARVIR